MSLNEETRQTVLDEALLLDPEQDPLRGINEDTPLDEATPAWNIKLVGDHQVFAKEDSNVNYAPLLFNNLRWPGTKTIVAVPSSLISLERHLRQYLRRLRLQGRLPAPLFPPGTQRRHRRPRGTGREVGGN